MRLALSCHWADFVVRRRHLKIREDQLAADSHSWVKEQERLQKKIDLLQREVDRLRAGVADVEATLNKLKSANVYHFGS